MDQLDDERTAGSPDGDGVVAGLDDDAGADDDLLLPMDDDDAGDDVGGKPTCVPVSLDGGPHEFNETQAELEAEFLDAAEADDVDTVRALLVAVDHRSQNHEDDSAYFAAVAAGAMRVVKLFVEELNHSIEMKDHDDATPLLVACSHGHIELVEYFIAKGANLAHKDMHKWTPLLTALRWGNNDIVKLLVEKHNVPLEEKGKLSPLHVVAMSGDIEMAHYLLDRGCNARRKNHSGTTPSDVARIFGQYELSKIFADAAERQGERIAIQHHEL